MRSLLTILMLMMSWQIVKSQEVVKKYEIPEIKSELEVGTQSYLYELEADGQTIPMEMTRTISKLGENWVVNDHATSAFGDVIDEAEFTATFQPVRRNLEQGGMDAPITYLEDKVKLQMMGNTTEIPMNGPYITEGPGLDLIVAGFPLKANYSIDLLMLDVMSAKSKTVNLKVEGTEKFNDVDCMVVKLTNIENDKDQFVFWINPENKSVLKMTQINPVMGNMRISTTKK